MTAAAVTNHVNDHINVEFLAELKRQLGNPGAGLRVFTINVEDGHLQALSQVGGVVGGAG